MLFPVLALHDKIRVEPPGEACPGAVLEEMGSSVRTISRVPAGTTAARRQQGANREKIKRAGLTNRLFIVYKRFVNIGKQSISLPGRSLQASLGRQSL